MNNKDVETMLNLRIDELKEENQTLRDRMKGIVHRCGLDLPEAKEKPEGYYRGRLTMIHLVANEFVD